MTMRKMQTAMRGDDKAIGAGSCTLVGAGPGDPELLTLQAVKAIARATVLLVDDLVSDAVVALATPGARVIRVGKRGACESTAQTDIDQLMLAGVREGQTVVRLKGGDPLLFGRAGEELAHLRAAGIEVKVINGITAALAAATALGTALTHREHAHGVVFLTGQNRTGEPGIDWRALAACAHQARLTLVIYMGMAQLADIQHELLTAMPPGTPAAVVQDASLGSERRIISTLGQLHSAVQQARLTSPSVILVGDVLCDLMPVRP